MKTAMIRPCAHCPFRNDIPGYLTKERTIEISNCLIDKQRTFPCHETLDEDMNITQNSQHCAGALIFLEAQNRPNQWMRWMERLQNEDGKPYYDHTRLDYNAPVFKSRADFIRHHAEAITTVRMRLNLERDLDECERTKI